MLRWFFSHAFVDLHAEQIVDQFVSEVPLEAFVVDNDKWTRKRKERVDMSLRHLVAEAHRFQSDQKLNFFQRARLAQQVQDRLISRGYPVDFAHQLAAVLTGAAKMPTGLASTLRAR